jgi:hypothetical protein
MDEWRLHGSFVMAQPRSNTNAVIVETEAPAIAETTISQN